DHSRRALIQNAAAETGLSNPVADREGLYDGGVCGENVENPEGRGVLSSRYGQQIRSRPGNCDVLINRKLAAGQGNRLSLKRGIEINRVTVIGVGERLAQRAEAPVVGVDNSNRVSARGHCDCAK